MVESTGPGLMVPWRSGISMTLEVSSPLDDRTVWILE